jgi:hypothetical protein
MGKVQLASKQEGRVVSLRQTAPLIVSSWAVILTRGYLTLRFLSTPGTLIMAFLTLGYFNLVVSLWLV